MVPTLALWLPVLIAAVLVFAGSSIIHMVPRCRRNGFRGIGDGRRRDGCPVARRPRSGRLLPPPRGQPRGREIGGLPCDGEEGARRVLHGGGSARVHEHEQEPGALDRPLRGGGGGRGLRRRTHADARGGVADGLPSRGHGAHLLLLRTRLAAPHDLVSPAVGDDPEVVVRRADVRSSPRRNIRLAVAGVRH